jgi:hypothetical protein
MELDIDKLKLEIEILRKEKDIKVILLEKEFYSKVAEVLLQSKLLSSLSWKYDITTIRDKRGNKHIEFYLSYHHNHRYTAISIIKILGLIKPNISDEIKLILKEGVIFTSNKNKFKLTFSSPEIGVKFVEDESLQIDYVKLVNYLKQIGLIK